MENVLKTRLSKDSFIVAYLKLWNGGLKLTDKEFDLMVEHVKAYYDAMNAGVSEPYLSELVFSAKKSKEIREGLKISHQNWHNYKEKLFSKKVFIIMDETVTLNPCLIPRKKITFEFEII